MFNLNVKSIIFKIISVLGFSFLSNLALAIPYHVTLDTSDFSGTGWLDLQFNPGTADAPAATASLSNFSGALDTSLTAFVDGDVSGNLPGNIVFSNSSSFNAIFQPILMGGLFSFDLLFDETFEALIASGTSFTLALYGDDMSTALGNADPFTNSLLSFELASGLTTTVYNAKSVTVSEVPEPQAWLLLLLGVALVAARKKSIF